MVFRGKSTHVHKLYIDQDQSDMFVCELIKVLFSTSATCQ